MEGLWAAENVPVDGDAPAAAPSRHSAAMRLVRFLSALSAHEYNGHVPTMTGGLPNMPVEPPTHSCMLVALGARCSSARSASS